MIKQILHDIYWIFRRPRVAVLSKIKFIIKKYVK